jgi:hypothetical protein
LDPRLVPSVWSILWPLQDAGTPIKSPSIVLDWTWKFLLVFVFTSRTDISPDLLNGALPPIKILDLIPEK